MLVVQTEVMQPVNSDNIRGEILRSNLVENKNTIKPNFRDNNLGQKYGQVKNFKSENHVNKISESQQFRGQIFGGAQTEQIVCKFLYLSRLGPSISPNQYKAGVFY